MGWIQVNSKRLKNQNGFSLMEIIVAVAITVLLSALSVKPISGYIHRIKAKSVNDGIKHYLQMARSRAIANPNRHCGVFFKLHDSASTLNDELIAFYDVGGNNIYDQGTDTFYSKPYVIPRNKGVAISKPIQYPDAIVFRGDGSAHSSLQLSLKLKQIQSTVDVLASTGRVKVVMK
jgi:prepilin-type N-terminal cleavage/methylation domain-containing protein